MTPTDKIIAALPQKSQTERNRFRVNAELLLNSGTPQQKADADRVIQALIDLGEAEAQTVFDRLSSMTVADRVAEAFRKQPPTETESAVILALLNNPGATSTALSKACEWKGQIWHEKFGTLCRKREAGLWPAEPAVTRDGNFYSGILAHYDTTAGGWTMKPDVAAAFAKLGLVARQAVRETEPE